MSLFGEISIEASERIEQPWRVLHVIANHERAAARHLAARSLEHYLPLYTKASQWTDRIVALERPLFPGYVFVRFTPEARYMVLTVPGVLSLLGNRETGSVAGSEIERIRAALVQGYAVQPYSGMALGTRVRIQRGIFAGVEGIVTELRRLCSVVIAVSSIDQCFSLETEIKDIEILDSQPWM